METDSQDDDSVSSDKTYKSEPVSSPHRNLSPPSSPPLKRRRLKRNVGMETEKVSYVEDVCLEDNSSASDLSLVDCTSPCSSNLNSDVNQGSIISSPSKTLSPHSSPILRVNTEAEECSVVTHHMTAAQVTSNAPDLADFCFNVDADPALPVPDVIGTNTNEILYSSGSSSNSENFSQQTSAIYGEESGDSLDRRDDNISDGDISEFGDSNLSSPPQSQQTFLNPDNDDDVLLYPGATRTKDSTILDLFDIYLGNKWTLDSLEKTLKLFVSTLPPDHSMPATVFRLFQYLKGFTSDTKLVEHFYCADNLHSVESKDVSCDLCGCKEISCFYEIPIADQIKHFFEHRHLASVVDSYRENRNAYPSDGCLRDICDGEEFRRVEAIVNGLYDLILIMNTDGIKPHVSSTAKFWPVMFSISQVPPWLRSSFIIVAGIWFDAKHKPDMDMYLEPFVMSLKLTFDHDGVVWEHPETGVLHTSKVVAPLIVADAPARADVQGIQSHNAKYACNICEQKTCKLPTPRVGHGEPKPRAKRRFLMQEEPAILRSHDRMVAQGNYVLERNLTQKRGVKRVPAVSKSPLLDLSTCVLPEYMHTVLKGIVLMFTNLWFNVKGEWYIGNHVEDVNYFLCFEIHPPDFVTRLPRAVSELSSWKANELRSWLLYYSVVIISRHMKEKYVQHWILLVNSIFLLLKEEVSEKDLSCAELMIRIFVRDIALLYENSVYVYNVHQMLHLTLCVRRWGPLWGTSAFMFESLNGVLARMIHGSKNQGKELVNQILIAHGVEILRNYVKIREIRVSSKKLECILETPLKNYTLTDAERDFLYEFDCSQLEKYGRCIIGKDHFSSSVYDKNKKRNNSYIQYSREERLSLGRIRFFFQVNGSSDVFCLISVLNVDHSKLFFHKATMMKLGHLIPIILSDDFVACNVKSITRKLIKVGNYVAYRPNSIEKNL